MKSFFGTLQQFSVLLLCPKIILYICEQNYFQKKILIEKFSTTESIKYPVLITGRQVAHFFFIFFTASHFFSFFWQFIIFFSLNKPIKLLYVYLRI